MLNSMEYFLLLQNSIFGSSIGVISKDVEILIRRLFNPNSVANECSLEVIEIIKWRILKMQGISKD